MKKILISQAVIALTLALAGGAGAESQILDEITVRGQKQSPIEESLSVREVRESPARDIGEALKQVEGVTYVRKGAIANDVVLRGFQKDNINVFVDGVRLQGACPSRMDSPAFHYDFAQIEQIRIVKGPYDLANPGGMGGTVDAVTRKPGRGFGAAVDASYGSWNTFAGSATGSYGTDLYDGLLGYAYKYADVPESGNGKRITDIYLPTSPNRYRPDAIDTRAYEIHTGWGRFGLNPTANSRTEIAYSYQDADHVLYPYLKMDAEYDRTQILNWNYRIAKITPVLQELKLQVYWDKVNHLMDDRLRASSLTTSRFYSMQTDARTETTGVKFQDALALGPGTLRSGIDYYSRYWNATNRRAGYFAYRDVAMIPDASLNNFGLFAEYQFPLGERLNLKGGVRSDWTWAEAHRSNTQVSEGTSRDFSDLSANLQLVFTPIPGLEIFTGLARGTRPPDQQELFLDVPVVTPSASANYWHGNKNLRSTVNNQADLGVKWSRDNYYVNASLFYSDLDDYINFTRPANSFEKSYGNVDATMWGAELGSQVALGFDLFLRGALSYVEAENETEQRPLAEIPPLRGSVAVRYDNGTWFVELLENLAREQDRVDTALQETTTPGWATTDLKAGLNLDRWTVIFGITNLLDKQYYSHLSFSRDPFQSGVKVPENGRNIYGSVAYRF